MRIIMLFCVGAWIGRAYQTTICAKRSAFVGGEFPIVHRQRWQSQHGSSLTMKDASASYWFQSGDQVQVTQEVWKQGVNLQGRRGLVLETWEKCDVDPTCCCAEHVDDDLSVRVEFPGQLVHDTLIHTSSFTHYFAEEELVKVSDEQTGRD